ncbi:hypothetical protein [Chondromyces apiculatus]|uniref:EcxA zinc-binding domain-containing protein n=1 Tax=Chondromyces apiculatus DSM 436 TaxID=1192034 RepID=A0A017T8T5_9BACT|nr:hypothetical protein [Chondromyces apiculatus]EYF05225.1 Hypothetical protein CAP_3365 [Chondromyces apiculatus DSM 436]
MRWMWTRALLCGALGLAAGSTSGCAVEREPINRVQPNALAKSFFVGANLQSPDDDPEFWTRAMVVDVGYGAAQDGLFSASYAQAEMTRIKWQITEDVLIGRISYERIEGTDGKGVGGKAKEGVVAVAFKILSHFDIRREYNPTTGEELNIVGENTSDRAWNEREYMRVDFSENLNTDSYDFDTLSLIGLYGGVEYEPLAYYVNDPNDADAPHFDSGSGYFDITTKAFAKPQLIDLSSLGWGIDKFPACYLDNDFMGGGAPTATCNPVELTIRHSFRRVENRDYEPKDWDGYQFQAYGPFLKERKGYSRNYGMTDEKWHRFATLYNIWERSHYYKSPAQMTGAVECFTPETTAYGADPNRDDDGNGTSDECEAVTEATGFAGARCDTFNQKCTLPYQARTEVPQIWYVTEGSNYEYFDGTDWATHEWDVALRSAVQVAKYAECARTGGPDCATRFPVWHGQHDDNADAVALSREVDDCRNGKAYAGEDCNAVADRIGGERGYDPAVIDLAKRPEMLVLCHSPVEFNDPEACGNESERLPPHITAADCSEAITSGDKGTAFLCRQAKSVRMGDLRYHTVNLFTAPQTPSAWGIYTDSEDPLTGEKVSASINVWTHINDLWSQGVVDQLRYIKGELKTEEVTNGTNVRDWSAASEAAKSGGFQHVSRAELDSKLEALTSATTAIPTAINDATLKAKIGELKAQLQGVAADAKAATTSQPIYNVRRQNARDTQFEAQLLTPAMQQYAGVDGMPATDGMMNMASPLRGMNPSVMRQIKQMKELALAERGSCAMGTEMAEAPISMVGLGDALQAKFGAFNAEDDKATQQARAEKMRRYLAQRAHFAVIGHEMGHSIGERHNFVSSSDAFNYRPQYWQLRTRNGKVNAECTDLVTDGAGCVGPRYFDPMTQEETDNLLWMFMSSSTMDYAGESSQDMLGLGAYDFAAARMFYGDAVAVFNDTNNYAANKTRGKSLMSWKMDNFGGIVGISPEANGQPIHYSQIQKNYDVIDCGPGGNGYWSGDDTAVQMFKPATWDEEKDGVWHPVIDGHIVKVDGQYSRCKQQQVDYVPYRSLRMPTSGEAGQFYRGGPAVDINKRVRVPYGFATDRWADLGNLSVYRHDNGADAYELFSFFITQQEVGHIFDNYRRGRHTFSVRGAANRTLERYNAKMRDGAKGLGLLYNIYKDFALESSYEFNTLWPFIASANYKDNILASGLAFDHFTRMMARPEPGVHWRPSYDTVYRAAQDAYGSPGTLDPTVTVPNGATGYYGDVSYGGKPLGNALAEQYGEYDSEYTMNAGAYYDKVWTPMLMTESVDNFISDSRTDFLDARYRSVSLADLFPEGYRRWLANNLTLDDEIKGVRVAASATGVPEKDGDGFPSMAMGWTSWWTDGGPQSCFPSNGTTVCSVYAQPSSDPWNPQAPANTAILDPQVGWEQQKFLIAMTLGYLPENQKRTWLNQMMIWERQTDVEPAWQNRIELHYPDGAVYLARTEGKETIFGKSVQRGIAARMLEYANELMAKAYVTQSVTLNGTNWYEPVLSSQGKPIVKYDATIKNITPEGNEAPTKPGCQPKTGTMTDEAAYGNCECEANRACAQLERYVPTIEFMRQAISAYQLCVNDDVKGIYDLPSCGN